MERRECLLIAAMLVAAVSQPANIRANDKSDWYANRHITFRASETEVNVPGKPETWYGTAMREDIGKILDFVEIKVDPYDTCSAHDFSVVDGKTSFVLRTPKGGRYIFAYDTNWLQLGSSIKARYKAGEEWVDFPLGKIAPDYVFSGRLKGESREFCYWIEVPDGQTETRFEIDQDRIRGALIADKRVDPFDGMPGRKPESMFDYPDPDELMTTELGRAVLYSFCKNEDPRKPIGEEQYQRELGSLAKFEKMNQYITNQRMCWEIGANGLRWRMSGDRQWAEIAGEKASRIAGWPTWGYPTDWTVKPDHRIANFRGQEKTFNHNHTLSTTIKTAAMAAAYDLACDGMNEDDRLAFRMALDHYAHLMYVRSFLNPGLFYGGGNWGGWYRACVGLAGAALYGENRYATDWIDRFKQALEVGIERLIDPNGQAGETVQYLGFGVTPNMLAALAIQRAMGSGDVFQIADGRLNKLTRSIVYLISPNGQNTRDFGDTGKTMQFTVHNGLPANITGMLCVLSQSTLWPDVARWAAHRGLSESGDDREIKVLNAGRSPIMNILLFKPGTERPPMDYPEDFPLGWHGRAPADCREDIGYVFMRTGFDSSDDIKLGLRCGHCEGHHGHPSQGSFTLDAYGDLLSQSAGYNLWARRPEAYNTVSFDKQGQVSDHTVGRACNDGHVERFVHTPVADICLANMQPAFRPNLGKDPSMLKRCLRHVLFARKPERRGYFVLVDDVDVGDGAEHEYHWDFHTTPNHKIEPDGEHGFIARSMTRDEVIQLWNERGQSQVLKELSLGGDPNDAWYASRWPGPSSKYPWVKEVKVDLRIATIWPEEFTYAVTYMVTRWLGAKQMMGVPDWLRVTQKAREGVFFTVLYPEREDIGAKMPSLERIVEEKLWGTRLGQDITLFSKREGSWKYEEVETDARLVYVGRDEASGEIEFAVSEATTLKVGGEGIFTAEKRVTAAGTKGKSVTDDGGEWRLTGPTRGMP